LGKKLRDIWKRDDVHGKPVMVEYIDQERHPFSDPEPSISWEWIEDHMQICRYSLDIRKCKNNECCGEYRAPDAAIFLNENNGFLPPTMKGKDGHFINPIHAFQYHDKLKIPKYNSCCPSISRELHQRLCYSICGKYFLTLKFISDHKHNVHPRRCNKKSKSPQEQTNETEMDHVLIPLNMNFNVAEDIVRSEGMRRVVQDSREVQSDED